MSFALARPLAGEGPRSGGEGQAAHSHLSRPSNAQTIASHTAFKFLNTSSLPHPHNRHPCASRHRRPPRVISHSSIIPMRGPVHFNDEFVLPTGKVSNEIANGKLPHKFEPIQPPPAQLLPKPDFSRRLVVTELARVLQNSGDVPCHEEKTEKQASSVASPSSALSGTFSRQRTGEGQQRQSPSPSCLAGEEKFSLDIILT